MTIRAAIAKPMLLAVLSAVSLGALASQATPTLAQAAPGTAGGSAAATVGGTAPSQATVSGPGLATWFGPGFYGRTTACGQTMSPTLVGVASRTLPCGTLVQLGYRGHRLIVPVLDRGPYGHTGALWDLTTGAARALKIKDTVRLRAQVVGSVPNAPTLGQPPASSGLPAPVPVGAVASPATTGGATAN